MGSTIWKYLQKIVIVMVVLYVLVTSYWMLSVSKNSTPFSAVKFSTSDTCVDMISLTSSIPSAELTVRFPYADYANGIDIDNSRCVLTQYLAMDSSRPDAKDVVLQVFFTAVTDSLLSLRNLHLKTYSPDTALAVLGWAERCFENVRIDSHGEVLWSGVSDYWFNHLARCLTEQQAEEKDLKYDFRFRYLSQRLAERGYNVNMRDSKVEKFKENMVAGNWTHLISATWNDSGFPLRAAFLLIGLVFMTGVSTVVSLAVNLLRNK